MLHSIWDGIMSFVYSLWWEWLIAWKDLAPLAVWVLSQLVIILILVLVFKFLRKSKFGLLFEIFVEKIYEFFEEILEESGKRWIKVYVVTLFFIILLSNISSWFLDIIKSALENTDMHMWEALGEYIVIPTTTMEFNVALALISIVLMLFAQFRYAWIVKFFLEYLPITWKWILDIKRTEVKSPFIYRPAKIVIKTFDIVISLFVWVLDIVGIGAKIISLSARLYGNMIAGGILLWFMVVGINGAMTKFLPGSFAVIAPLVLFAQGLLVAVIQAFVFPLLVGIFMKLAQSDNW